MGLADNAARAAAKAKTKYPSYGSLPSYVQSAINQRGAREYVANQTAIPTKPNFLPKTAPTPPNKYQAEVTTTDVAPTKTVASSPVQTTPAPAGPVQETVPTPQPVQEAAPAPEAAPEWSVYNDPFYLQQLQDAQNQFNMERINALGDVQYQEVGINRQLDERPATAEAARRRLAGNYASRGMAGGGYGALSRAEAEQNARELTARTSLRDQITELNRQFVGQFGAEGTDWLGTYRGSQAQNNAIQAAINNRVSGLTTVG